MLATERAVLPDNGLRNYLRRVPNDSVLYMPGLDYGNWYTNKILDYSGYANHGTISGATWTRLPSGLWTLSFDGDDYVDCGNGTSLQITGKVTILIWLKLPSGIGGTYGIVMKHNDGSNRGYGIWTALPGNIVFAVTSDGSGTTQDAADLGDMTDTGWALWGFTCDTSISTAFLVICKNGVSVKTKNKTNFVGTTIYNSTQPLRIGGKSNGGWGLVGQAVMERVISGTIVSPAAQLSIFNQERSFFGV